ncbi:serpin family protein [Alkalicoccus urumqiensis]|uniref:Serine protease n=1 Tax=Alkalicoccus urumqiensis TaxID=1548213 RepID=A0A2P6MLQ3_ALKUR|nr:serpin family protein [Alkalicoccus urumqiensis]PRO67209.1 serine protease [Alkalicoccus urumqiensis]
MSHLKTTAAWSGFLSATLLLTACGENSPDAENTADAVPAEEEPDDVSMEDVNEDVPGSTQTFGWNLFDHLLQEEENQLLSPASISTALAMTMAGADGETKQEMTEVLSLHGLEDEEIDASFQALITLLEDTGSDVELAIANSIWKREDYGFDDTFIEKMEEEYQAQVEPLTDEEPINDWISGQTNGLIEDMISEVRPQTVMYLINAVYFQGDWAEPFEESLTTEGTFTTSTGKEVDAMMMRRAEKEPVFLHSENDAFQAVSLPYGEEERWSMNVILPHEEEGSLQKTVDAFRNEDPLTFSEKVGNFRLPRFQMEEETTLNEPLIELGMPKAFNSAEADFSRMVEGGGIFISEVLHNTFIDVDETGTEAAAATSVAMEESAPGYDFDMIVDRPFLFTVQDEETGVLLFAGYVNKPEEG